MKVLTICPTKGRAKMCQEMVNSFNATKELDNTLVLGLDVGDEQIPLYRDIQEHKIACKANATVTEIINDTYKKFSDYDYFHITNDDVVYKTKGWDKKMANILKENGGGVAYGNDLFQSSNHPTFPFVSANVVSALEWLQMPLLNRYYGDTVWKLIAENCHCLYYLGGVIVEHKTWFAGKSEYKYDEEIYKKDSLVFAEYLRVVHRDVNKVMEVLNES